MRHEGDRWQEKLVSDVADKWGVEVAKRGFTQLPNYLLLINQFLDREHRLSPVEFLVVIQLVGSWWRKSELPFPSMGTLAKRCGVSDRQIQRSVNKLVEKGFLARTKRRGEKGIIASNAYDLQPLVAVLGIIAKAFPNEFPRKVGDETRKAISAALASDQQQDDYPGIQVEGLPTTST
jgi:DNA-binding transcriptional regulator YhcF (GntR family)